MITSEFTSCDFQTTPGSPSNVPPLIASSCKNTGTWGLAHISSLRAMGSKVLPTVESANKGLPETSPAQATGNPPSTPKTLKEEPAGGTAPLQGAVCFSSALMTKPQLMAHGQGLALPGLSSDTLQMTKTRATAVIIMDHVDCKNHSSELQLASRSVRMHPEHDLLHCTNHRASREQASVVRQKGPSTCIYRNKVHYYNKNGEREPHVQAAVLVRAALASSLLHDALLALDGGPRALALKARDEEKKAKHDYTTPWSKLLMRDLDSQASLCRRTAGNLNLWFRLVGFTVRIMRR